MRLRVLFEADCDPASCRSPTADASTLMQHGDSVSQAGGPVPRWPQAHSVVNPSQTMSALLGAPGSPSQPHGMNQSATSSASRRNPSRAPQWCIAGGKGPGPMRQRRRAPAALTSPSAVST
ncbi:hypothetical protein O9K51_04718 [Purpureocillium lavendulum]|uniref:Uncharacterized protein n=1 Tax=Purpureocillium lavendulum TaxID=1247861 RepID=A0AB34FXC4_9HYPO|nr:hypothetical protein O9K51_04718 [Purpureocillium lavendulum]